MAWFKKVYEFIMAMRAKAADLVQPIKQRIREILRGNGDRLVIAHAAADRAFPQERPRSAVIESLCVNCALDRVILRCEPSIPEDVVPEPRRRGETGCTRPPRVTAIILRRLDL